MTETPAWVGSLGRRSTMRRKPRVYPWMLRDYLDDGELPVEEMLRVWPFEIIWSLPLTDRQIAAAVLATRVRQQQHFEAPRRKVKRRPLSLRA